MKNFVLCLGYFDSIHIGHRFLLAQAKDYAEKKGLRLCVSTFNDGFLHLVGREEKEIYLLHQRQQILKELGIDETLIFPATKSFLNWSKQEFCEYICSLKPSAVVVGSDYSFGRKAEGKVGYLSEYLSQKNIDCVVVNLLEYNAQKVSSTAIRILVSEGKTEEANILLGEPYFVCGTVVHGRNVGTKIGFPTINLEMNIHKQYPKCGVYVTETVIDGCFYPSVTNVGKHPTFQDNNENIETHILADIGNIYGKTVFVRFYKFLREIIAFENGEELQKQIEKDIKSTKEYFYDKIRSCGQQ